MSDNSLVDHIDWKELHGKEARGIDKKVDLGEVQEIGTMYVLTKKGRISKDKFYIPKYLAQGYDGKRVWFNVTEGMMAEFKRDDPPTAKEYERYKGSRTPEDIEDRIAVITEIPLDTMTTETVIAEREPSPVPKPMRSTEATQLPPVINWETTLHKGVRSTEGEPLGNVIALYPDSIHVESEGSRVKYEIPKAEVEGFNGAEVRLRTPVTDLERYVKQH